MATVKIAPALLASAALLLGGCGGGIYFSFSGNDGGDDQPPAVSLTAATGSAAAGDRVHLAAAATDDDFVAVVSFYRLQDDGSRSFVGSDSRAPYEVDATMPDVPRGTTVRFYADAVDSAGQHATSAPVAINAL
jgi:hypothetical protein